MGGQPKRVIFGQLSKIIHTTRKNKGHRDGKRNKARMPTQPTTVCIVCKPNSTSNGKGEPRSGEEPAMLMYADDMVLWGDTKEELQTKLQQAVKMMDKLDLNLSMDKTELQYNQWVKEAPKGRIEHQDGKRNGVHPVQGPTTSTTDT